VRGLSPAGLSTVEVDTSGFRSCPDPAQVYLERVDEIRPRSAERDLDHPTVALGAPYPTRRAGRRLHPPRPRMRRLRSPQPRTPCRWPAWVHYRTPWLHGRPSPTGWHASPRRDGSCWVLRLWLWSRSHPAWRSCSRSAQPGPHTLVCARDVPVPPIMGNAWSHVLELISRRPSDGHCARMGRDHKRSRGTLPRLSSRSGVPASRGRPSR
jgi:hypothetical protein